MTSFLDTSALVKVHVPEPRHDLVRELLGEPVVAAELVRVELPAALWRKHRLGEISASQARLLAQAFEATIANPDRTAQVHLVGVSPPILKSAAQLVARHPLRASDAVQLASALAAAAVLPSCRFGSFDRQLNAAASAEGLALAF